MKTLAVNNEYVLTYDPSKVNRYAVYRKHIKFFSQMIAQSPNFTQKLKSYFTAEQIRTAQAKVYAMAYVSRKFKTVNKI